jgi:phosphatidylserine synthase
MSKCILNINNGKDNILFRSNLLNEKSTTLNKDRQKLFFFICIPLRILLAFILLYLYTLKNEKTQRILSLVSSFISLFILIHLVKKNKVCKQWWSNNFEILLSIIALFISIVCYFNKKNCMLYLSVILFISIISGIIQSIIFNPFKN